MNIEDLIELLKSNPKTNFIGMAITPLQITGIDAAVLYLQNKKVLINGFILVASHPSTGRSINKNDFTTNIAGIQFIEFDYTFAEQKTIKDQIKIKKDIIACAQSRGEEKIYFAWTETVSNIMYAIHKALPYKQCAIIKIDDGAGSYMSSTYLKYSYLQYEYPYPIAFAKALIYGYVTNKNKKIFEHKNAYIDANIFKFSKHKGKNKYEANKEFAPFYNEVFRKSCQIEDNLSIFEDAIVINTQPLKEMGITDGIIDYQLYSQLNSILKKSDRRIVLKPHPREQEIEKYRNLGWVIYNKKGMSQEGIFAVIREKPFCLISLYSSTLLNAYGLSNLPVISLARIMLQMKISKALKKELKEYIKNYNSIVYFPASLDELSKYLDYLCIENQNSH